jgi:hypothetical protein
MLSACREGTPISGQQLVDPGLRDVGDATEHIGQPRLRIDVVEFRRLISVAMTAAPSAPRSEPATLRAFDALALPGGYPNLRPETMWTE